MFKGDKLDVFHTTREDQRGAGALAAQYVVPGCSITTKCDPWGTDTGSSVIIRAGTEHQSPICGKVLFQYVSSDSDLLQHWTHRSHSCSWNLATKHKTSHGFKQHRTVGRTEQTTDIEDLINADPQ